MTIGPTRYKTLLVGFGALMVLAGAILVGWKIPQRQVAKWKAKLNTIAERELNKNDPKLNLGDYLKLQNDRRKLENDARTTLVQAIGGAALLIGLFFTWRNLRLTEQNSQKTLERSRIGQISDRFTKAIDQLGAVEGKKKKLEIRLGGIYALEGIAKESSDPEAVPKLYGPTIEVLTAYVRENAPWKEEEQRSQEEISPSDTQVTQNRQPSPKLDADIQAVLTVLGRRDLTYGQGEDQALDLRKTDLRNADLTGARLQGANLRQAHLERAILRRAHLERADLMDAVLEGARLEEAHLEGADLTGAHLERAILREAVLEGAYLKDAHLGVEADLRQAHLKGVNLSGAHLEGARLDAADLKEVNLSGANLKGAILMDAVLEGAYLEEAHLEEAHLEGANLRGAHLEGAILPTTEQLCTVRTLYQAQLDPELTERIRQQCPERLDPPQE